MLFYHLTCSQNFYGQKDAKVYYYVPAYKVWAGLLFMVQYYKVPAVFVYLGEKGKSIGQNEYIGVFSAKYGNFRTPNNKLHKTFIF